jgi:hypothetical protein
MFVRPGMRRRGGARQILRHLEEEVHRRGFRSIVLETGCDNTGAIALYESEGYLRIPEFPGCLGIPVSRCYIKQVLDLNWGHVLFCACTRLGDSSGRTV